MPTAELLYLKRFTDPPYNTGYRDVRRFRFRAYACPTKTPAIVVFVLVRRP